MMTPPIISTANMNEMITHQTHLSLQLTKRLLSEEAQESNLVYSPLSIQVVLSMIAAGSSGQTLDQLLSFLGSKTSNDLNAFASELVSFVLADGSFSGGPLLSNANGLWFEKTLTIKPSFTELMHNVYKAKAKPADFQNKPDEVKNEVNSWAERETRGLIKEVLPPGSVDSFTKLILANALYFKGSWEEEFKASSTKEHGFHLLDGTSVQVPFMTSYKNQYVSAFDGFKVLGLPYEHGEDKRQFFMYIYLPNTKDGLHSLVEKLGSEPGFLDHHLPQQRVQVGEIRIPKFEIEFGFEGSNILKSLGLDLPFSGGEGAFTEMVDSSTSALRLSLFHKAFIKVDEEGTEAAAVSVGVVIPKSAIITTINFVADHPFLFLIREGMTGTVLFIGHVLNPAQST
ncbi:hypothetical protein Sjap_010112 [Stephania japonica]|uniref:Serpin domain-containing protein n=1 Tax=Stephania japonica TaxID=461633 RepID=A0AAP0P634_9MAGN